MLGQLGYPKSQLVSSPSRTYVAMLNKGNFDGYYFREFTLPEGQENNCNRASWYYLNLLDYVGCVQSVFPVEQYRDYERKEQ